MELEKYLNLYADCIPVKGAKRSIIMDLGRKELYEISNEYTEIISKLEKESIGKVVDCFTRDDAENSIIPFISFILENELGHIVSDPNEFPKINLSWDDYSKINNAIIDIENKNHNLDKIFEDLDELGTKHLQIRFYRSIDLKELTKIAESIKKTSFYSIELISFFEENLSFSLKEFLKKNPLFTSFTLTNSYQNNIEYIYANDETKTLLISKIIHTKQNISSCADCGVINEKNMVIPDIQDLSEFKRFNSCLNKKISIDINGKIKNCPSMKEDFGFYEEINLMDLIEHKEFTNIWNINKDEISICKDCEYRYVCTDCRAFVNDIKSDKPFKCDYNPYTGVWEN
jgi:SPASM domain peptide maturase of grasp-with-spasm system